MTSVVISIGRFRRCSKNAPSGSASAAAVAADSAVSRETSNVDAFSVTTATRGRATRPTALPRSLIARANQRREKSLSWRTEPEG
jgi:hypothetical protein